VLTCSTARDWSDGLSKVMRRSAVEAAVVKHSAQTTVTGLALELSLLDRISIGWLLLKCRYTVLRFFAKTKTGESA